MNNVAFKINPYPIKNHVDNFVCGMREYQSAGAAKTNTHRNIPA